MNNIKPVTHKDYLTNNIFTWCTGCGNYSIWGALRNALVEEQISPKDVLFVHDIGCNGNGADKIGGYGFKGLHGRSLPFGAGASLANRNVKVIASSGDGGILAEGIGHLIHAIRSNYNMLFLIHNNSNFALTTGQASPASNTGIKMNSSPDGTPTEPINIANFFLNLNPSFLARGYSGNQKQLKTIIQMALQHKGFALIEILQLCPSYNKINTYDWYNDRVIDLMQNQNYNPSDLESAKEISRDLTNKIATGILYRNKENVDYYSRLKNRTDFKTELVEEVKKYQVSELLSSFI